MTIKSEDIDNREVDFSDVVRGRRAITTDTALRLGRYFGTTPAFWINLQIHYDLDVPERTVRRRIEREVEPRAA